MKTFILTLWFVLAVSTTWACEVQPLFSPYDKVDDAIHAHLERASKSVHFLNSQKSLERVQFSLAIQIQSHARLASIFWGMPGVGGVMVRACREVCGSEAGCAWVAD